MISKDEFIHRLHSVLKKSIYLERYSRLARDVEQVIDDRLDQRNASAASNRFGFPFRVAGDQRAVGAGGRLGAAEDVNPFVDLLFELVLVDEAVDLHGAEEVADAFADAALGNFLAQSERRCKGSPVRAAQNAAKYVDHGRSPVALVPAHLAIRAEGQPRAAIDHVLRTGRVAGVFGDDPTLRPRF